MPWVGRGAVLDPWPQPGRGVPRMVFRRPPKAWHQGRRDRRPPPGADGAKGPRWELGTLTWALPVATAQHPTWCLRPSSGHWILPFPELPPYALGSSEEVPAHLPARHTPVHPSEPCSGHSSLCTAWGEGSALGIQTPAPSPSVRPSSSRHMLGRSNRAAVVSRGAGWVPCLTLWALQWLLLSQAGAAGAGHSAGSHPPLPPSHTAWVDRPGLDKRPQSIGDWPEGRLPAGRVEVCASDRSCLLPPLETAWTAGAGLASSLCPS